MSWNYDPSKYPSPTQPPPSTTSHSHHQQQQPHAGYGYSTSQQHQGQAHGSPGGAGGGTGGGGGGGGGERNGYGDDGYGGGEGVYGGYYAGDHSFPTTPSMTKPSDTSPRPAAGIPSSLTDSKPLSDGHARYHTLSPQGGTTSDRERGSGRIGGGSGSTAGGQQMSSSQGQGQGQDRYSSYAQQYTHHQPSSYGHPQSYGYGGYDYAHPQSGSGAPGGHQGWSSQSQSLNGSSDRPAQAHHSGGGQHHHPQQRTISGSSAGGGTLPSLTTGGAGSYGENGHPVPATAPAHAGSHSQAQNQGHSPVTPGGYGYDPRQYGGGAGAGGTGGGYGYSQMTGTVQPGHYSSYTNPAYLSQQANSASAGGQGGHHPGATHSAPASNAGINPSWPGQGYDSISGSGQGGYYSQSYGGGGGRQGQQAQSAHPHPQAYPHSTSYPNTTGPGGQALYPHGQQTMHPSVMSSAHPHQIQGYPPDGPLGGGNKKRQAEEELVVDKGGKKSKKGKKEVEVKEVDPNAPPAKSKLNPPRQSSSAWQIFFTDHLAEVKATAGNEKINVANIAKDAGLIYQAMNLEDKKPFVARAEEARSHFQVEYAAWLAALTPEEIKHENAFRAGQRKTGKSRKGNLKDLHAPKKPLSAYFLFLKAIRSDERLSGIVFGQETETTKQSMNAAARWRSFNDLDKKPFLKQAESDKAEYETMRKLYEDESAQRARGEVVADRDYQPSYVREPPGQELLDAVLAPGGGTGMRLTAEQLAKQEAKGHEVELGDIAHESEEHHSSPGEEDAVSPSGLGKSPDEVGLRVQDQDAPSAPSGTGAETGAAHRHPHSGSEAHQFLHDLVDTPPVLEEQPALLPGYSMDEFTTPAFDLPSQTHDLSSHHIEQSAYLVNDHDDHLHGAAHSTEEVDDGPIKEESMLFDGDLDGLIEHQAMAYTSSSDNSDQGGAKIEELPLVEEPERAVEAKVELLEHVQKPLDAMGQAGQTAEVEVKSELDPSSSLLGPDSGLAGVTGLPPHPTDFDEDKPEVPHAIGTGTEDSPGPDLASPGHA